MAGKRRTKKGDGPRHGGRVPLYVEVLPEERLYIQARAKRAGVSVAELARMQLVGRVFDTPAVRDARPIVAIGTRLRVIQNALEAGDLPAAMTALKAAQSLAHEVLVPLAKEHDQSVRDRGDDHEGWTG